MAAWFKNASTKIGKAGIGMSGAINNLMKSSRQGMGIVQLSDDPELAELQSNLVDLEASLKKLRKNVQAFSKSVGDMCRSTAALSETVLGFCGKDADLGTDAMKYRQAVNSVTAASIEDGAVAVLQQELRTQILTHIEKQLAGIADLKSKINGRELQRSSMETKRREIQFMTKEENKATFAEAEVTRAQEALEMQKHSFEQMNNALLRDLRKLKEHRFMVVNTPYQALKRCQHKFFSAAATAIGSTFEGPPPPPVDMFAESKAAVPPAVPDAGADAAPAVLDAAEGPEPIGPETVAVPAAAEAPVATGDGAAAAGGEGAVAAVDSSDL